MSSKTQDHPNTDFNGNEAITPIRPGQGRDDSQDVSSPRRVSVHKLLVPILFITILIAGIAVFFYLPDVVEKRLAGTPRPLTQKSSDPSESMPASGDGAAAVRVPTKELAPWQLAQQKEARDNAQNALESLLEKQKLLQAANVNLWADQEYSQAVVEAAKGDELFVSRDYSAAQKAFIAASKILDMLIARKEIELQAAISRGQLALDENNSTSAAEHFALALKIDPQNDAAEKGLGRAENLDQLLALLSAGRTLEDQGELNTARDRYTQAVELDNVSETATKALARINGKINNRAFNIAMTQGFSELDQGNYAAARNAFNQAGKIRSGSAEVAEALAQVESRQRLQAISTHRKRAEQYQQDEKWKQAAEEYDAVLALDTNLLFAREGKAYSLERADVMDRLNEYIQTPGRLSSQNVHDEASAFLNSLVSVEDKGPILQKQMSALAEQLRLAAIPVSVNLVSDNKTQVAVHRVGRFGVFAKKELQLRPGAYTAVGSRPGFRDVRREFDVQPGKGPVTIIIKCEEPI